MEEKPIQENLKDLLHKLEETQPIDSKGNPFVILPSKDLKEIKKTIEEFSEEFTPKIKE